MGAKQYIEGDEEKVYGTRMSIWATILVIIVFFVWASWAEIDQVTRGQGQIIPSARTQVVQVVDGGVIQHLYVREGDLVERGQKLAQLDQTRFRAAYLEEEGKLAGLSTRVDRARAEIFGHSPIFSLESEGYEVFRVNQLALYNMRKETLAKEIQGLSQIRELADQELGIIMPLMESGDVSLTEVLRLRRQLAELDAQILNKQNNFLQEALMELNRSGEELEALRQSLIQKREQLNNTILVAPLHGTVNDVKVTTVGGVLRPGEELMNIVPIDDNLLVEARVAPTDIAFLKLGQTVSVKVDAYDYTIHGSLEGELIFISPDTRDENTNQNQQPHYIVQVVIKKPRFRHLDLDDLHLQPGMTVMIEVKTGKNTVLNYLIKPIIKTLDQSMGER